MNQMYGFEGEVRAKYSQQMWDLFTEIFNWLPLAHLLQSRVLVMHGGLFSRDGVELKELVDIDRNRQPPEEGNIDVLGGGGRIMELMVEIASLEKKWFRKKFYD